MKIAFFVLVISGLLSSACSMKTRRTEDPPPVPAQTAEETAQVIATPPAETPVAAEEPKIEIKPATPPPAHTSHHAEKKGVEPEKALSWLKNGNVRYRKGSLRKDGQSQKDVKRLSTGQAPHSIILSCSDSRVPPEVVFDQKLGEVFVIRNAGEIPDRASIASIEYAIEHLGSRLVVVMGHTSCGAVKAALGTMDGSDAGSPSLNALVHDIHPRLASFKEHKHAANVEEESWANARGVAHDLIGRSEIIRSRVANGDLVVKAALYRLEDGKVIFDAAQKEK